jgi:hypothetical protein
MTEKTMITSEQRKIWVLQVRLLSTLRRLKIYPVKRG